MTGDSTHLSQHKAQKGLHEVLRNEANAHLHMHTQGEARAGSEGTSTTPPPGQAGKKIQPCCADQAGFMWLHSCVTYSPGVPETALEVCEGESEAHGKHEESEGISEEVGLKPRHVGRLCEPNNGSNDNLQDRVPRRRKRPQENKSDQASPDARQVTLCQLPSCIKALMHHQRDRQHSMKEARVDLSWRLRSAGR